jgi:hypothetical protein
MKLLIRLLASVVVVNPVAALAVTSAASAEPRPDNPFDQEFVTTESRTVRCIVEPGRVLCSGSFANAPIGCGGPSACDPDDPTKYPANAVWIEAEGGGLQWNTSNMQSTGYAQSKYDLVLTYGQVFNLKGWTVEPSSVGTRFTNDRTGHGMFVSRQGVTSDASPAAPENVDVCAAATGEALLAALKTSPDYRRVAYPTGFGQIQCSPPFALGSTEGTVQSSGVLFRRDGSRWTVLDVGSAIDCAQYGVTADDALKGCVV